MVFNTYFQYVCLTTTFLCIIPCILLRAQTRRKRSGAQGTPVLVERNNTFLLTDTLVPSAVNLDEVIVTGRRQAAGANTVSGELSSLAIERAMGNTLASLLEHVSGVSSVSTGTTVAKPVIHGMYGSRILLINNGARQRGQEWGIDHTPEVDMNGSSTIRVVKGSEGVKYGPEAIGGVIVMEQEPLPFGRKPFKGGAGMLYGSNGHRYVLTLKAEGAFPFLKELAWRIQGTCSNSGDRSTAHYLLNNTGTRGNHFTASLGYDHKCMRIEGFYSCFDDRTGVMFSAQMGSEDLLTERIRLGRPVYTTPFTRHIGYPYQRVVHRTAVGKVRYDAGSAGVFYWQSAWQGDDRREYRIRRMGHSGIPVVSLHLSSSQHLLRWKLGYGPWQTEIGGQFVAVDNYSRAGNGVVPVIPNYTERGMGMYGVQSFSCGRGGFEAGIRLDGQETRADGYDWTGSPYGGTRRFGHVAYSLGGHYRLSGHWRFTSNFGLAWRAPHVYELYSNGNEVGSGMFVKGDASMRAERSRKWIFSADYRNRLFDIRLDSYLQWIDGYIYDGPTGENITVVSGAYPVFRYRQVPAFFRGMDFDFRFTPSGSWEYLLSASFIRAHERGMGNYLPYIPSFRMNQELAWTHETGSCRIFRFGVNHRFVARQTRFDPAADLIPYAPAAYHLFGLVADIGWPVKNGDRFRLMVAVDNVLNREYKEYTNRSRYYAHDMGRDIRCSLSWIF